MSDTTESPVLLKSAHNIRTAANSGQATGQTQTHTDTTNHGNQAKYRRQAAIMKLLTYDIAKAHVVGSMRAEIYPKHAKHKSSRV